jgi:hypothetical protein
MVGECCIDILEAMFHATDDVWDTLFASSGELARYANRDTQRTKGPLLAALSPVAHRAPEV